MAQLSIVKTEPIAAPLHIVSQAPIGAQPFVDTSHVAGAGSLGVPQLEAQPNMPAMQSSLLAPSTYGKSIEDTGKALLKPLMHVPSQIASYGGFKNPSDQGGPIQSIIDNPDKGAGVADALTQLGTGVALGGLSKALGAGIEGATKATGKAMRYASASPESLKNAATRAITSGTPGELLTRALKPPVTMPGFEESIEKTLPRIASQKPNGVKGFSEAAANLKNASNDWYQNLIEPHASEPIDTTPAFQKQMQSIPATNIFENPGIVNSTAAKAAAYDMSPVTKTSLSPILDEFGKPYSSTSVMEPVKPPLRDIDNIRVDTNAKLNDFYNKSGGDKYAALSNPETARLKAVNDSTRDLVYDRLADRSGIPRSDIDANQELYGHSSDVSDVAGKRATVAGRANPMSLQESLKVGPSLRGITDFLGQRMLKNLTNSDAVTNAAIDRFNSPDGPTLSPRDNPFAKGVNRIGKGLGSIKSSRLLPLMGLFRTQDGN